MVVKTGNGGGSESFAPGDIVLGKIKGYPPWPGIIVDEENVPKKKVLSAWPGKSHLIVRFFPAADYGFNKAHELHKLNRREVEAWLSDPPKNKPDLKAAYELAKNPDEWNDEQNSIVKEEEAAGLDEEDMLAEDGDEEEKPVTKKRKSLPGNGSSKKAKTQSTSSVKKPTSKSESAAPSVSRKSAGAEEDEKEEELDPEAKKVKSWRHTLQRGFLSKGRDINPDDMEQLDKTMKLAENYDGITTEILRVTKIGKVMRRIVQLKEDIPKEDEFNFKSRANSLCDKWQSIFSAGKESSETKSPAPAASQSAGDAKANGTDATSSLQTGAKNENIVLSSDKAEPSAADESVLSAAP